MKLPALILWMCLPLVPYAQGGRDSRHLQKEIDFSGLSRVSLVQSRNLEELAMKPIREGEPVELVLPSGTLGFDHATPFIAFSAAWDEKDPEPGNTRLFVSFSADGSTWEPWEEAAPDEHAVEIRHSFASGLLFRDSRMQHYRIRVVSNRLGEGVVPDRLLLNFFSPGERLPGQEKAGAAEEEAAAYSDCTCPLPAYRSRKDWNCPQGATSPSFTKVTHLIVHHSAGTNVSNDWSAIVLAVWNLHVAVNGWSDIGYNWLVAPSGELFEGRGGGDNVLGAHFCSRNGGTMGVCMLGTYTTAQATAAAREKLVQILAWKACQREIDPQGSGFHASSELVIPFISGHRQGCATECPGEQLFGILPLVRHEVAEKLGACGALTSWAPAPGVAYFRLSPNPSSGGEVTAEFSLPGRLPVRYEVFSAEGKLLAASAPKECEGEIRMALPELGRLPAGVYPVLFRFGQQALARRLVVMD